LGLFVFIIANTSFAQIDEVEAISDLESYRIQIEELEYSLGRYDLQLIEPILRLADTAAALNQFDEVAYILDRAVQIVRVNEGLYAESQIPILKQHIENDVRRGNWTDASATMDHLYWLYTEKSTGTSDEVIQGLRDLSDLHLEGVVGDDSANQAVHYKTATVILWAAIKLAERDWEPLDTRLIDLYYDLLRQYYFQFVAMEAGGDTGYELRNRYYLYLIRLFHRTSYSLADADDERRVWSYFDLDNNEFRSSAIKSQVRPRRVFKDTLYQMGSGLILRMRRLYEQAEPENIEAQAMVDLYSSDWQLMFASRNTVSDYRLAYNNLLVAGVPAADLLHYFSEPALLPMKQFYPSVAEAVESREQNNSETASSESAVLSGESLYYALPASFPNLDRALIDTPFVRESELAWEDSRVSFELGTLDKVSRWINGRYVTQLGVPLSFTFVDVNGAPTLDLDEITDRMHFLHFRPRFVHGEAQPSEGVLEYRHLSSREEGE